MTAARIGEEGFRWFIGLAEAVDDDPLKLGRIKVRVLNEQDIDEVTTDQLVYATIMMPSHQASYNKIGASPTGIQKGSMVFGFFMDSNEENMPVIMGTWHKIPKRDEKLHDVHELARNKQSLTKDLTNGNIVKEPESAYAAKYPHNKTLTTETGHAIEIDDTPGEERLHVYHKTGTYIEINKDGRTVIKSQGDSYEIDVKNKLVLVKGNVNMEVSGNMEVQVDGDYNLHVDGNINMVSDQVTTVIGKTKIDLNP